VKASLSLANRSSGTKSKEMALSKFTSMMVPPMSVIYSLAQMVRILGFASNFYQKQGSLSLILLSSTSKYRTRPIPRICSQRNPHQWLVSTYSIAFQTNERQAFSVKNQNIMVHTWINPRKMWATRFDDFDMGNEESFIMFGYGSPAAEFSNRTKPPDKLTSTELKAECLARVRSDPNIGPKFIALAEHCIINTAYVHTVKDCQAIKKWDTSSVTLIGDAVFK
jgi:hypothetical protein